MRQNGQFNHLHSLLIDLQYLIADITNELYNPATPQNDVDPTLFYETWVIDIATRHLILSIQSVLSDMSNEEVSAMTTLRHFQ
jgi:hypothetical protein